MLPGLNAALGIGQSIFNSVIDWKNYRNQQDVQQYQKDIQREAWNREDTAIQRRVSDLKAAGLNPVLAAGIGASSSAPIRLETPTRQHVEFDPMSKANVAYNLLSAQADISRTVEQKKLIEMQNRKTAEEVKGVELDNSRKAMDNKILQQLGVTSGSTGVTRDIANMINVLSSKNPVLGTAVGNLVDKIFGGSTSDFPRGEWKTEKFPLKK